MHELIFFPTNRIGSTCGECSNSHFQELPPGFETQIFDCGDLGGDCLKYGKLIKEQTPACDWFLLQCKCHEMNGLFSAAIDVCICQHYKKRSAPEKSPQRPPAIKPALYPAHSI